MEQRPLSGWRGRLSLRPGGHRRASPRPRAETGALPGARPRRRALGTPREPRPLRRVQPVRGTSRKCRAPRPPRPASRRLRRAARRPRGRKRRSGLASGRRTAGAPKAAGPRRRRSSSRRRKRGTPEARSGGSPRRAPEAESRESPPLRGSGGPAPSPAAKVKAKMEARSGLKKRSFRPSGTLPSSNTRRKSTGPTSRRACSTL